MIGKAETFWLGAIDSGEREDETDNDGFLPRHRSAWISPDDTHLATMVSPEGPLSDQARGCQAWNLLTKRPLPFLLNHAGTINHAAFHPDATCWRRRPHGPAVEHRLRSANDAVAQMFRYLTKQSVQAFGTDKLDELHQRFAADGFHIRRLTIDLLTDSALALRAEQPEGELKRSEALGL